VKGHFSWPTTLPAALQAEAYRERIMAAVPAGSRFQPLMTLYLTDRTPPEEVLPQVACFLHYVQRKDSGSVLNYQSKYWSRIYVQRPAGCSAAQVLRAKAAGVVAFKLYPAGATTNSDSGVTDISLVMPTLRTMAQVLHATHVRHIGRHTRRTHHPLWLVGGHDRRCARARMWP